MPNWLISTREILQELKDIHRRLDANDRKLDLVLKEFRKQNRDQQKLDALADRISGSAENIQEHVEGD